MLDNRELVVSYAHELSASEGAKVRLEEDTTGRHLVFSGRGVTDERFPLQFVPTASPRLSPVPWVGFALGEVLSGEGIDQHIVVDIKVKVHCANEWCSMPLPWGQVAQYFSTNFEFAGP